MIQSGTGASSWAAASLVENKHYWWRVKAQDARAESGWVVGDFLMNALNDAPPTPTVKNPGNGAWTALLQPSLEVNPVMDPEGEAMHYEFEVYTDAGLTQLVAQGVSPTTALQVPVPLADKTTHWWRMRALDVQGAPSAWSLPVVLYVSVAPYQAPTIAVTAPATAVVPDTVNGPSGAIKQTTIRWEGTDPNIEATVALYYSSSQTDFAGTLIVDGLRQSAGVQSGSYVWNVTNLASATYYVYAVIYDSKGVGKAYAPGAVVIPSATASGSIVVTAGNKLRTSEDGSKATFNIRLGSAPMASVVVPVSTSNSHEGVVSPQSLTFTPQNWAVNQTVAVTGQNDCVPDGNNTYQVVSGKSLSTDPNYIGLSGTPVNVVNLGNVDFPGTTNNPKLHICGVNVVSQRKVDAKTWEYTLSAELTNTGVGVRGVTAKLAKPSFILSVPFGMTVVEDTLVFGAVNEGDTAKTSDTVTVRTRIQIPSTIFRLVPSAWTVVVQP